MPPDRPSLRFARPAIVAGAVVLVGLIAVGVLSARSLTRAAPSWWQNTAPSTDRADRARDLENAAVSQLYLARKPSADAPAPGLSWQSEPWSVSLRDTDVTAWLTSRLPRWLEGQRGMPEWPDELSQFQVRFDDNAVRVGVRVQSPPGDPNARTRYVSATFIPEIDDRGSLWLRTTWAHMGRLPVPASWIIGDRADAGLIPANLLQHPDAAAFLNVARADAPLAVDPVATLEDRRRVRLLNLRIRDGRLELTMRTESRPTGS
jgi:hypothetical protein